MTMNDTWGYKSYEDNWKSSEDLIRKLADIASKGGNFLLNVGPTPEGLIPRPSVRRLEDIGRWMAVNSESIHGTTASPIGRPEWGRCTAKGDRLYLHVFDWPSDGTLEVALPNADVERAYLLADKRTKLTVEASAETLTIAVGAEAPDRVNSGIALELNAR
jgi:alpha-L-fucosidase